jgi:hypothetical protein
MLRTSIAFHRSFCTTLNPVKIKKETHYIFRVPFSRVPFYSLMNHNYTIKFCDIKHIEFGTFHHISPSPSDEKLECWDLLDYRELCQKCCRAVIVKFSDETQTCEENAKCRGARVWEFFINKLH